MRSRDTSYCKLEVLNNDQARQARIRLYTLRASARLPLFSSDTPCQSSKDRVKQSEPGRS